jgi:hypothetical protein
VKSEIALDRRTLLRALGTKALLLAVAANGGAALGCGPEAEPEADALDAILAALSEGRDLGRSYLAERPEERSRQALRGLLLPEPESRWAAWPGMELARRLAGEMDADFEQGRVVAVQGWVLSRVEARLFALAALGADDPDQGGTAP